MIEMYVTEVKMNFYLLKRNAKRYIATSDPKPLNVAIVYSLLILAVSLLVSRLFNVSEADLKLFQEHMIAGNYDYALELFERIMPETSSYVVEMLLRAVVSIVGLGFTIFTLNTVRRSGADMGNLLDGFGFALKYIWLTILEAIFIFLWSLLLVFPGFVAACAYSQATFIMLDHPEYSAYRCLQESKRLMMGHKWEFFLLQLSFIGWRILLAIPTVCYAVQIWTLPFIGITMALYYEQLCGHGTEPAWTERPEHFESF